MENILLIGTRVIYCNAWGIGPGKAGEIVGTDTMQGRIIYDVKLDGQAQEVWGYDYQVTEAAQ